MQRDPQVDLIFSHFIPRYEATGVDPNDLRALMPRVTRWQDWCRLWSEEGARHEALGEEAKAKGYRRTAAESFVRAAMYYHYGKHLFADRAEEFQRAHEAMLRCYSAGAAHLDPPIERVEFPYKGVAMPGWLRKPRGVAQPPVAIILPGLDACKEELHAWAEGFVDRGLAALTLDGPGQGETSFHLPVTHEWGGVIGAVIDVLERRDDVDGSRVGVVGQSLGALYAPLAAAGEPRLKACIANCGPFDWGTVLPKMPKVSQEVFRVRSHSKTIEECHERGKALTLRGGREHQVSAAGDLRRRRPSDRSGRGRAAGARSVGAVRAGRLSGRQSRLLQHQLQVPPALRRLDGEDARTRVKTARIGTARQQPAIVMSGVRTRGMVLASRFATMPAQVSTITCGRIV